MSPDTLTSLQDTNRGCVGVARQAIPELCAVREHWKLSLRGREGARRQLFLWALWPGMVRGYSKRVKLPEELMEEIQGRGFHREVGTVARGCSTVLVPDRVVQALNLNLEELAAQPRFPGGFVLSHDALMGRSGAVLGHQKKSHQHVSPAVSAAAGAAVAAHEIGLPQEWIY
ncbi:hypothetical protein OPV22_031204 [Ensete ventricosum]|uniref:Uncharacterized protein n=1 Tax=Ensete ventricosum TaxID=4639 RepID=A0AAV8PNX7_ENSVE|nr:hypothetical protein OPV22_031204 [Ensete ventricosum]